MATYNCGQKVEKTVRSILSQNKDLFELIVIDGASTDDSLYYIKKYEEDLTLISEEDDGIYYAFNKGLDLATGKYLYFIGAGDCLKPDVLENVKEFLPTEKPSVIYGNCYFASRQICGGREFSEKSFVRDNICQQGVFYHRKVFDLTGGYDLQYKTFADWFFNLKCFMDTRITKRYVDLVIADYEEGGISTVIDSDPVFKKEFPRFVKKHFGIFKYMVSKTYLFDPHTFNYIYYGKYSLLPRHFLYNYSVPNYLASLLRPYVFRFRDLKKSLKSKG